MRTLLALSAALAIASPAAAREVHDAAPAPNRAKLEKAADATPLATQPRAPIEPPPRAHPGESPRPESLFTGPPPLPLQA